MLYMIHGVDKDDGAEIRAKARDDHFAYLDRHEDIVVLGGATLADADDTRTGSVLIINVPSRAEADAFSQNEPFRMAGLFETVTVTRMRRGQWNPEVGTPAQPAGLSQIAINWGEPIVNGFASNPPKRLRIANPALSNSRQSSGQV